MNVTGEALPLPELDGAPKAQAKQWLAYLYSGLATPEGEKAFKVWLAADPAHAEAYACAEQIWRDVAITAEAHGDSVTTPAARKARPIVRLGRVAIAASLVAGLMVAIGVWQFRQPTAEPQHYASAVGEIRTVTLQDGSSITLGGDSALDVTFDRSRRLVHLAKGAAYFEIVADKTRPFAVEAGATAITVVGTQFEVRKDEDDVRVAVAEGVVTVAALPGPAADAVSSRKPLRLEAGSQVTASLQGTLGGVETFDENALAWREGRLVYVDETLSNVIAELNRYRDMKIRLADPALGNILISIALPIDKTDAFLSALEASEPVTVTRAGGVITISAAEAR